MQASPVCNGSELYPFLADEDTITHLKTSKVMFIMRGLPGSGKTTVVSWIKDVYPKALTCSADDHFYSSETQQYVYDHDQLPQAHEKCQAKARAACEQGMKTVVIDNTNVRNWEMRFYTELAEANGYTTIVVKPKTPWRHNVQELASRNKHGVAADILEKKLRSFDKAIPRFYGWFLNEDGVTQIKDVARSCLNASMAAFPELTDSLQRLQALDDGTKPAPIHQDARWKKKMHCTAFYAGRGTTPGSHIYAKKSKVLRNLGKASPLKVIGIVITPRTVGARVELNCKQIKLFKRDEDEHKKNSKNKVSDVKISNTSSGALSGRSEKGCGGSVGLLSNSFSVLEIEGEAEESEEEDVKSNPKQLMHAAPVSKVEGTMSEAPLTVGTNTTEEEKLESTTTHFSMEEESGTSSSGEECSAETGDRFHPTSGYGSRAHITISTAQGVQDVQTGLDLLDVIKCEERVLHDNGFYEEAQLEGTIARYYGEGRCVVYLDSSVQVSSIFSQYL